MRTLTDTSFKFSVVWQVVCRSQPEQLWTMSLKPSHMAVKAYMARQKMDYPAHFQRVLDPGDVFDSWINEWKASRLKDDPSMPMHVGRPTFHRCAIGQTHVIGFAPRSIASLSLVRFPGLGGWGISGFPIRPFRGKGLPVTWPSGWSVLGSSRIRVLFGVWCPQRLRHDGFCCCSWWLWHHAPVD